VPKINIIGEEVIISPSSNLLYGAQCHPINKKRAAYPNSVTDQPEFHKDCVLLHQSHTTGAACTFNKGSRESRNEECYDEQAAIIY